MREELLKVNQINKSFGPTKALVNVDFTAYRGEVHGLIGENGSGKSTEGSIMIRKMPWKPMQRESVI